MKDLITLLMIICLILIGCLFDKQYQIDKLKHIQSNTIEFQRSLYI